MTLKLTGCSLQFEIDVYRFSIRDRSHRGSHTTSHLGEGVTVRYVGKGVERG